MMKAFESTNVYEAALQRAVDMCKQGHRLIVAFSAGKDSTIVLELMLEAARLTGTLPLEVWMRDEEIMFPGTYEYAERIAQRPEIKFHWLVAGEAEVNIFNRQNPYWWVFDDRLTQISIKPLPGIRFVLIIAVER
jgi:predicted phosphoadenosine phosphosulfate sulfurtransferase